MPENVVLNNIAFFREDVHFEIKYYLDVQHPLLLS